jgi:hypothetical protein
MNNSIKFITDFTTGYVVSVLGASIGSCTGTCYLMLPTAASSIMA